jgi:hypothetical protein
MAHARSVLALYTDGLVETRNSDLDLQIDKAGAELRAACADGLDLDKIADREPAATLLRSEILTNAVVHGLGPVGLRLRRTDIEIAVIVSDRGRYRPQPRLADPTDESGRGPSLLEMLAPSWGARATTDGKDVWFTLAL